jgi:hypothetical protein
MALAEINAAPRAISPIWGVSRSFSSPKDSAGIDAALQDNLLHVEDDSILCGHHQCRVHGGKEGRRKIETGEINKARKPPSTTPRALTKNIPFPQLFFPHSTSVLSHQR